LSRFTAYRLFGVTGSGKTEVYLRVIARVIAAGNQALVLVPEIGLTPQLIERFRTRFAVGVAVLHSGLAGTERRDAWREAHNGRAAVVIGTRSAVFASLPRLGVIIVDEEHDASYKQHEGFRYSARDLAVLRAQRAGVPIVLGSATPSLETLENVAQGRYTRLSLPERPGTARAPQMRLIDLKAQASENGLSQLALQSIRRHLDAGAQVIVFLNRRGYAPTLFCNRCGWVAPCAHCDARMTLHRRAAELRCHHCGAHGPVPLVCAGCGHALLPVGQGTERVEETLQRLFPDAPLARLDRDTAGVRGGAGAVLARVHSGEARILIGTQMLTKGHHFPDVSLVVILDADQGLFASDYRATERLAQTIVQVAGRAGRAARIGEVLIQTEFPEHPLLNRLISSGYEEFAQAALAERRAANWPPFSRLALLRAEARDLERVEEFLRAAAALAQEPAIKLLGPATALLARRADHFRAHLLIEAAERGELQRFLARWLERVAALPKPAGLRWSIDVDPLEVD
jgi:primosomal protein N' (replication factor Y)